jgi:hypothetical protein
MGSPCASHQGRFYHTLVVNKMTLDGFIPSNLDATAQIRQDHYFHKPAFASNIRARDRLVTQSSIIRTMGTKYGDKPDTQIASEGSWLALNYSLRIFFCFVKKFFCSIKNIY